MVDVLGSQRELFDVPDDVAYFNAASLSPMLHSVRGSEGRISARRSPSGQRCFTDVDVRAVLTPGFDLTDRATVGYWRVSSANQRTDLASQRNAREQFCLARGLPVDRWITEVGGGMDLTRPELLALMSDVKAGKVATLVVAHQDRLARFGFEYLDHEAVTAGCEILSVDLSGGPV